MIQVLFVNPYDLLWSGKKHQLDYKNQRCKELLDISHVIHM
jgi:hypothetical protein